MSLLEEAYEQFTILNKITENDGYGGLVVTWQDGASFLGALSFSDSVEMKIAQAMGVTAVFTLTTKKDVNLEYHTVFRRESDGKIFRTTSDGEENRTPASAALNMRNVSCEEWMLNG